MVGGDELAAGLAESDGGGGAADFSPECFSTERGESGPTGFLRALPELAGLFGMAEAAGALVVAAAGFEAAEV